MKFRLALITFAVSLPLFAFADDPPLAPLAECKGAEADASHLAIDFDGKSDDLLSELVRFKHLDVAHVEWVGSKLIKFKFSCIPVDFLVTELAAASGLQVARQGDTRFRLAKVNNLSAITKLRDEAAAIPDTDPKQLIVVLKRVVALSQPGGANEPAANVEDEYHQLGNLALKDKDTVAAERWYRARLAELDRNGAAQDTNYGIAVSNIADALAYSDKIDRATTLYERALGILEKQSDLAAPANAVIILQTLSNFALAAKRFDKSEALADKAWKLLSDPRRSQWIGVDGALEFSAVVESEFGSLGPKERSYPHFERALELLEARYPSGSKELVDARWQVMRSAGRSGNLERASVVAEQQLAAADRHSERASVAQVFSIYQLLGLYAERGELDRVIALWPRLIDARRALLGDNSPNVVSALRQLATLYRLNAQWTEADATDRRAAVIKPVDDTEALDKVDPFIRWAMDVDPATPVFCAKFEWTPTGLGYTYITPMPLILAFDLVFKPDTTPRPLPADKSAQARYLEQTAECFSNSSDYAGRAMEQVLRLRIELNGANSPQARQASERAIHFFQQDENAKAIERVRALSGG